jgi:mono/diheme cytochrome c family protein
VWNREQTDAALAHKAGADLEIAAGSVQQPWRVPSRAECLMCHSRQANFSLTLHEAQLNRGDQLAKWERLGLLRVDAVAFERDRSPREKLPSLEAQSSDQRTPSTSPLFPRNLDRLRRFARADDTNVDLEKRARSYLGANCAHCHTLYGGGNSAMEFDWLVLADEMHAFDRPLHGDFGLPDARVIAPGDAARSVLVPRISTRGPGQMPPVGTRAADPAGTRLLVEWIESLK